MKCRAKPYEGKEPYLFFSYCHQNAGVVYPIIERMAKDGYRIWYDDGIHPGDDWLEVIGEHLQNCSGCVAAITPESAGSHACRSELSEAMIQKKPVVSIMMEDFELSVGTRLLLGASQYVRKFDFANENAFYERLYSGQALAACKGEPIALAPAEDAREQERKAEEAARLAKEKQDQEEKERLARELAELERQRKEKEEQERLRKEEQEREQLRIAQEEADRIRREDEAMELLRKELEEKERARKELEEAERLRREREEAERLRREAELKERLRKEQEELEQLRQALAERERLRRELEEQERARREAEEQERLRKEQEEQERLRKEQEELSRLRREMEELERRRKAQEEEDRLRREQAEKERLAQEQAEQARLRRIQEEKERLRKALEEARAEEEAHRKAEEAELRRKAEEAELRRKAEEEARRKAEENEPPTTTDDDGTPTVADDDDGPTIMEDDGDLTVTDDDDAPTVMGGAKVRAAALIHLDSETIYPLYGALTSIGRSHASCDVVFSDDGISRHHADIIQYKGSYYLRDQGSANGSCVNGQEVAPNDKVALGEFAQIQLHNLNLIFVAGSQAKQICREKRVHILRRGEDGGDILLTEEDLILRRSKDTAPGCIHDPKVSRSQHAVVYIRDDQGYVKDLDSRNGTHVNGSTLTPQKEYPLLQGAKIRVGDTILTYLDLTLREGEK